MSNITSIGDARTPNSPVETTFAADTGQPVANHAILLFGHKAALGGTVAAYTPQQISNAGDPAAALTEGRGYFGGGLGVTGDCELVKMIVAAINANIGGDNEGNMPPIWCMPLASTDTAFGTSDVALTNALNIPAEFLASCYDAISAGGLSSLATKIKTQAATMSAPTRTANNQFGSFGVVFNRSVVDPSTLPTPDSQYLVAVWERDTGSPAYSIGESAAACAAVMAANPAPYNPLDDVAIGDLPAPAAMTDWISVGDAAESETALLKGWTPIYVQPNGEPAFVRTVTTRISADGSGTPIVTSYYDVQDFMVLYFFRQTVFTRFKQPDFKKKNSAAVIRRAKGELIRMAKLFEDQEMFQAVDQLAKQFVVQRTTTDRHGFECLVPSNVVPGLHRKKTNIQATTEFDSFVA